MEQRPFPKPVPIEPLSETAWLRRTDRAESGREPFFTGRDAEYEVFRSALESLEDGVIGGGTMIFQGAPGAGKSALMLECAEAVRQRSAPEDPWAAVVIRPETLMSAPQTMRVMLNAVNKESRRLAQNISETLSGRFSEYLRIGQELYRELSERGGSVGGVSIGGRPQQSSEADLLAEPVFMNAAPLLRKFRLAVFVDEAQNMPVRETTRGVIDCLHNPPEDIPLVAAFFGLSGTQEALRRCGLSRFADQRVTNLEALSMEDAGGSLRRMLDTYYAGADAEKTHWSGELARLSQGWPQHVNRVGLAAGQVIRKNNGKLERRLLDAALQKGAERKNDYYAERLAAGLLDPEFYKLLALAAGHHVQGTLSRKELRRLAASELEEAQVSFDDFLSNALHAGLLSPVTEIPYHYRFPIPSLSDYLRALPAEPSQAV